MKPGEDQRDLAYLRLVHLVDAFEKTEGVQRILSIGCGLGIQEAFLAGRLPIATVFGTDWCLRNDTFPFQNLSFAQVDILSWAEPEEYDFVFSIECLEHIKEYKQAFQNMAAKVKGGKYLYVSVPFATAEEQKDEQLVKREWTTHEHYVPGFDFEDLQELFTKNGFDVMFASNMFHGALANNINSLLQNISSTSLENCLANIARLFFFDLTYKRAINRTEAVGIRILGRKQLQ